MGTEQNNTFNSEFFMNVLNQLQTNIYITDLGTDEIVYMNETMKKAFQIEEAEGLVCWKVLQTGQTGRCSFCRKGDLQEGKAVCIWNEENSVTGRIYQNHDSLIQWKDKTYHIQNSADITEYQHLREEAQIDELTGMYNRRAGKGKLEKMILAAKEEDAVLVVALYDVNELKHVNDRYGHGEGDHLLRYIAEAVKNALGSKDMVFRLSGDEFVIAFYNDNVEAAEKKIFRMLEWMQSEKEKHSVFYEASFSYGMIEVYPKDNYSLTELIAKADEQMYIRKRSYHIRRAQENLEKPRQKEAEHSFEYDKEHLYAALRDSTDDYTFVGNMETGTFQYSPSMVAEFGLPGEILENAAAFWGKLIHPDDAAGFLESNQEIADGRIESHCIEYRAKNVKGEWIWLRCRGHMIRNSLGEPALFAGFISNLGKIRDRKGNTC